MEPGELMRRFTGGELMLVGSTITSAYGAASGLGLDATIYQIPSSAVSADTRVVVVETLKCSALQPAETKDMERGGAGVSGGGVSGGSVKRTWKVFSEVPAVEITPRMRFVTGGVDYRIAAVTKMPLNDNPRYLELLIEDEKVSG
jgi:hypothetical protein